jgi:predicted Zn-dependent peptidase
MMKLLRLVPGLAWLAMLPNPVEGQDRYAVLTEPGTPVVAAEILLSVGPVDEDASRAGLAYLAARSVAAPLMPTLDSLGASLTILPQKDALSFTVTAAPEAWQQATRLVAVALFQEPADSLGVLGERRAIVQELRGRVANPADAAARELDRAFFGTDHPWGRPTVGTPVSVERLSVSQVQEFLSDNFTPDRAFVAVVGPVDETPATRHLRTLLGSAFPAPLEVVPFRPSRLPLKREYDSITTWIAASFRFPETGDEEALRFVAYLAADALSFSPERRSVYDLRSEVFRRAGAGEFRLQLVVPPDEADHWASEVGRAVSRLGTGRMRDDEFEAHLRRYAGERLNPLLAPEDRARALARQLLVNGRTSGLVPDLDEMTQERVRNAARSLDPPTLVLLGPALAEDRR